MKKLPTRKIRRSSTSTSTKTKKVKKQLSFTQTVSFLLAVSILLFGVSGFYWYKYVLTDPDRILSDMLNKSLQTTSVYRAVSQQSSQNVVNQAVQLSFTPQTVAKSITDLKEASDTGQTSVTTETLGTQTTDYVRYTDISIQGSTAQRNFNNILNIWGKRESNTEIGQQASFLNDALFVVVPFGNLNADQRKQLTNEINSVNLYNFSDTKTEWVNGRPVISYTVNLSPESLVKVLAKYVEVTKVGTGAELDPTAYAGSQKIQLTMQVDVLSRHLRTIEFSGSGRTETYGSYNRGSKVNFPTQTIDVNELQTRLSALEGVQ